MDCRSPTQNGVNVTISIEIVNGPVENTGMKRRNSNPGPVTMKDVATRAGVSLMTVSRVVRNDAKVAKKTRDLIQQAIQELNYIPDISAGMLSSKRSNMVAVILPSLHFEGHLRTVEGLSSQLREHGFHLLIGDKFYSENEERELLRVILGRRPAGIVMINSTHSAAGRKTLLSSGIPVIETWDLPDQPIDSVVGFSHTDIGKAMAGHLVESGYRKIGFIGGPPLLDPRGNERHKGFVAALESHGIDSSRHIVVDKAPQEISAGVSGISALLAEYPDTEAVMCLTDHAAMGAMTECRRRGIRIPDDIAIAGHGGFDFCDHLVPALTSTRIDAYTIGCRAACLLLARIHGNPVAEAERFVDIGFEIVPRQSTAVQQ